jgi:hypothetical protein
MRGTAILSDELLGLIDLFKSHGVEFLVVGAHAFAIHAFLAMSSRPSHTLRTQA